MAMIFRLCTHKLCPLVTRFLGLCSFGNAKVGEAKVGEAKFGEAKVGEAKVGAAKVFFFFFFG